MKYKTVKFDDLKVGDEFWASPLLDDDIKRIKVVNNAYVANEVAVEYDIAADQDVYVVDDPMEKVLDGFYFLEKKDGSCWLFGLYQDTVDGQHRFSLANTPGDIVIDPEKWNLKKVRMEDEIS